jgi:hypothetical protein
MYVPIMGKRVCQSVCSAARRLEANEKWGWSGKTSPVAKSDRRVLASFI